MIRGEIARTDQTATKKRQGRGTCACCPCFRPLACHDLAFQSRCGGYLFEKRSISDCLGYGSESVGSGLAGGAAAAVALGAGDAPGE
jgi:hypothetical protein